MAKGEGGSPLPIIPMFFPVNDLWLLLIAFWAIVCAWAAVLGMSRG